MRYKPLNTNKVYLITGAAGFIGSFLSKRLLEQGCRVIGIDNINDYYDVNLKHTRLEQLKPYDNFTFIRGDISHNVKKSNIFSCNLTFFLIKQVVYFIIFPNRNEHVVFLIFSSFVFFSCIKPFPLGFPFIQ